MTFKPGSLQIGKSVGNLSDGPEQSLARLLQGASPLPVHVEQSQIPLPLRKRFIVSLPNVKQVVNPP